MIYVITEGETDRLLLAHLLQGLEPDEELEVRSAGGRSSAVSLARSFLISTPSPVALVIDADTTDEGRIREQESIFTEPLQQVASQDRFRVILAVPEIEACLFPDKATAERVFGRPLSRDDWTRAHFEPKRVLLTLVNGGKSKTAPAALQRILSTIDPASLRKAPLIRELEEFIAVNRASRAGGK